MRRNIKTLTAIALIALLTFGSSFSAFAATVTPTLNASSHDPSMPGYSTLKFDEPSDDEETSGGITIEVDFSRDDKWVDWESSLPVEYVYVKGGNGGYLYHYPNGAFEDENLRAPNNNGGKQPEISHVTFYYKIKGSLTIVKKVYGSPSSPEDFTFEIAGPSGTQTVVINGAGSTTITGLTLGSYTVTEISIPDNYSVYDEDFSVTLSLYYKNKTLTFKNYYTEPTTEPTTAEPTTEPTTAEPTTAEPTTAEPTTAEPTTAEPTTAEPTTAEPTTAEPTTAEPTTAEPTTAEPTTAEPTTAEPTTAEPTTAEPTTAEPTTAEPTTAEPTTAEPTTEAPTQPTTEAPTQPTTEAPTQPTTEAPTQPTTEATTETVTEEQIPLGAAIVNFDEILPEVIPTADEELVLDEQVPLADALPQTGQLPMELYYGLGSIISLAGFAIRKKK